MLPVLGQLSYEHSLEVPRNFLLSLNLEKIFLLSLESLWW